MGDWEVERLGGCVNGTVLLTAIASHVKVPTYHIMLRGNNRQNVFIDDEDKARIIATISEKKNGDRFALYAYCDGKNKQARTVPACPAQGAKIKNGKEKVG